VTLPNGSCPVCESADRTAYHAYNGMQFVRCVRCDLVYLDPMPTPKEIAATYDGFVGTTDYFRKADKKIKRSRRRARRLKRYAQGNRYLDIGCNGGFMVEAARQVGFEAAGMDLDPVSIAYAREHYGKNTYFQGTIEALAAVEAEAGRAFDVIYCSEVIEHVPEIHCFVAALARLLKVGGIAQITTPDITHWRRPRNLEKWDAFCPPDHCLFFNPANIKQLLDAHGLRIFRRFHSWKPGIKVIARKV